MALRRHPGRRATMTTARYVFKLDEGKFSQLDSLTVGALGVLDADNYGCIRGFGGAVRCGKLVEDAI